MGLDRTRQTSLCSSQRSGVQTEQEWGAGLRLLPPARTPPPSWPPLGLAPLQLRYAASSNTTSQRSASPLGAHSLYVFGNPLTPSLFSPRTRLGTCCEKLMDQIHDHLEMPKLRRDFGTQTYEQQVVELSQDGEGALGEGWEVGASGGGASLGGALGGEPRRTLTPGGRGHSDPTNPTLPQRLRRGSWSSGCTRHLVGHSDALLITTRSAVDALDSCGDFYNREARH